VGTALSALCAGALFAANFAEEALAAEPPPAPPAAPSAAPDTAKPDAKSTLAPGATIADPTDGKPARPPPFAPTESRASSWERLLDAGGDFALVARPASHDAKGQPSEVRYQAATGFALHIRWPLIEHLMLEGYYVNVHMPVELPRGSLGIADAITGPPVDTYVFGARLSPNMTWGRIRAWVSAGAGWGRFELRRFTATSSSGASYTLRERGASFIEFPLGVGISFEIIKRWLSLDLAGTASFVVGQEGDAFSDAQAVDPSGKLVNVGPMPVMDASLVQTIGFSLLL
jgi:hypothetical protein